jgi:hypothetical protein
MQSVIAAARAAWEWRLLLLARVAPWYQELDMYREELPDGYIVELGW